MKSEGIGDLALARGWVTPAQLEHARQVQQDRPLGEVLVELGYLSQQQFRDLLSQSVDGLEKTFDLRSPNPVAGDLPGEVLLAAETKQNDIGRFILVRLLGRGGMGEVYKAWAKELHRFVALKFVCQAREEDHQRFLREARTSARLEHECIVPVYEVGSTERGPYLAMKYIEGTTLDRSKLSLRQRVMAIRDAALAIAYAHAQGVIHRDLKPQNIMVEAAERQVGTPLGATTRVLGDEVSPRVYVMDFGVARQTSVDTSISATGNIVGTPQYMSPEQARGRSREVDARSDVYSLGATLYSLLAGVPPFQGENAMEVIDRLLHTDPLPPRKYNPSIPKDLETIVLKCLDKDRNRRYPTASALAEDLQRFLEGEPVQARPATIAYRMYRQFRRNPIAYVLGACAAVALVIAAVIWFVGERRRRNEKLAVERMEALLREASTYVSDFDRDLYLPVFDITTRFPSLEKAVERCGRVLQEAPPELKRLRADASYEQGRALLRLGKLDEALQSFDAAIALQQQGRYFYQRGLARLKLFQRVEFQARQQIKSEADRLMSQSEPIRLGAVSDLDEAVRLGEIGEADAKLARAATIGYRVTDASEMQAKQAALKEAIGLCDEVIQSGDYGLKADAWKLRARLVLWVRASSDLMKMIHETTNAHQAAIKALREAYQIRRCDYEAYAERGYGIILSHMLSSMNPMAFNPMAGGLGIKESVLKEALAEIDTALSINPRFALGHLWRGWVLTLYAMMGGTVPKNFAEADRRALWVIETVDKGMASLRKATELDPKLPDARILQAYARISRYVGTVKFMQAAHDEVQLALSDLAVVPCDPRLLELAAIVTLRSDAAYAEGQEHLSAAERDLDQALQEDPKSFQATIYRVIIDCAKYQWDTALEKLEKYKSIAPDTQFKQSLDLVTHFIKQQKARMQQQKKQ